MLLLGRFLIAVVFVLILVFQSWDHSISRVKHVLFKLFGLGGVECVIGGESLRALGPAVGIATCRGWRKRTQIEEMQAEDPREWAVKESDALAIELVHGSISKFEKD